MNLMSKAKSSWDLKHQLHFVPKCQRGWVSDEWLDGHVTFQVLNDLSYPILGDQLTMVCGDN